MNYEGKKKIWSEFQKEIPDDKLRLMVSTLTNRISSTA